MTGRFGSGPAVSELSFARPNGFLHTPRPREYNPLGLAVSPLIALELCGEKRAYRTSQGAANGTYQSFRPLVNRGDPRGQVNDPNAGSWGFVNNLGKHNRRVKNQAVFLTGTFVVGDRPCQSKSVRGPAVRGYVLTCEYDFGV